jgi:hypothetical protein
MSPYPNGGDRYKRGPWYAAPYVEPMTLEERQRGPVRPPAAPTPTTEQTSLQWVASEFRGPHTVTIRGTEFHLPLDARIKRRPPLVWILYEGQVHVLSEKGDLLLSALDRLKFAELWSNI